MYKDLLQLSGKVAIVTGASKGIGEAIARGLAEFGAKVVVSSRKAEAVAAIAQSIRESGGEALSLVAHAGDSEALRGLVAQSVEHYGRLDIVVNNAATNPYYGPIQDAEEGLFDKIMAVNVRGPLALARAAYPHLQQGGGSIINIGSEGGIRPMPGLGLYNVSKAALISLTKVLAQEWGAVGIRVNIICPGLIQTRFSAAMWQDEALMQRFLPQVPLGRIGQPEEVALLAVYLASPAASFCTGGVYAVDGGHTL